MGLYFITVCLGWLDVGHWVCFIGYCGKLKPDSLLCSWMTVHLLPNKPGMKRTFLVVLTKKGDLDSVSAVDDDALIWSTGDAVHSSPQWSLLRALPNRTQSHFHAALTFN